MNSSLELKHSKVGWQEVSRNRNPHKGGNTGGLGELQGLACSQKEREIPKEFKGGTELISKINLERVWGKRFMGSRLSPGR